MALLPGLLELLRSPTLLVVGKGGVGKTTAAAAIALLHADANPAQRVHLISTDPAHSLGDVFDQAVAAGAPTASACAPNLILEELDAPARARSWFEQSGGAVAELVDRGTYLDEEDVVDLLEHTLIGMDEVMAALRLAELEGDGGEAPRIVVDTAPTGHTLRLLDAGSVLTGWSAALAAMAAKAGVVASRLTGRRIRFAGEAVLDEMNERVTRFEERVLARADFLVVTREGAVVAAETSRLIEELRRRGLRVAAVLVVGTDAAEPRGALPEDAPPRVVVPWHHDLTGCEGIRRWGSSGAAAGLGPQRAEPPEGVPPGVAGPEAPAGSVSGIEALRELRVVFFAGKGGVGKSTCAAAWALELARTRDVLLVGVDPAGSLGDVLGSAVAPEGTRLGARLVVRQVDAAREFQSFRDRYRAHIESAFQRLGLQNRVPLDRRVLESLLEMAPPGVDELFALGALVDGVAGDHALVLDTAPTGHFRRLVAMPERALEWTRVVIRMLIKYRSVLGLDDFADEVLQFAKRLRALIDLLEDPASVGVVVVTIVEPLPRLETERLLADLSAAGPPVAAVLFNRTHPLKDRLAGPTAGPFPGPGRAIAAPYVESPLVGPEALRSFVSHWKPVRRAATP